MTTILEPNKAGVSKWAIVDAVVTLVHRSAEESVKAEEVFAAVKESIDEYAKKDTVDHRDHVEAYDDLQRAVIATFKQHFDTSKVKGIEEGMNVIYHMI